MRVIYLCPFTGFCGGTRVIAEHVSRLAARRHVAEWWGLDAPPSWFGRPVPYQAFASTDQLGGALQREQSAAIVATWWQTAFWVPPNLRGANRGYYLVQDLDQETYSHDHSGSSYRLGLQPITESEWVTRQLIERWGLAPADVSIGVDHDIFRPLAIPRDPNRIFTAYRPAAGPNDLKGFATALRVVQLVREQNPAASLVTFGTQGFPQVPPEVPHIHVPSPSDEKLRELYSQAGCYLMTSRHEGFCLPAAEAMACGCPVVCTDAHGNMEFCQHGKTALVGASADELAGHVLTLQREPGTAVRVAAAGCEWVRARYRWDSVIDRLEALYS